MARASHYTQARAEIQCNQKQVDNGPIEKKGKQGN